MWLKKRLDELGMSIPDIAERIDRTPATVNNWIYNLNRIPWRLEDIDEWLQLADALKWTILDILVAAGYDIEPAVLVRFLYKSGYGVTIDTNTLTEQQMNIMLEFDALPEWKQDIVMDMTEAAIRAVKSISPDNLP